MVSRHRFLLGQNGLTIVELLIAAAVVGLIVLASVSLVGPSLRYFQRNHARQQSMIQMRSCMETFEHVMATGRASTVLLSPLAGSTNPTLSQIQFQSVDGASYTIAYSETPPNTVHLFRTPPGGVTADSIIATNVGGLIFGWDPDDPSILTVVLHMVVPLDRSGSPDSFLTLLTPPQTVRMINA